MKFMKSMQLTSHLKERKTMKKIIGLCAALSGSVFIPPCWGMEDPEKITYSSYQDLIPETGESFKVVVDYVNQGDSQHRDLVKKWVRTLFITDELLKNIQFDALHIDLRDIKGMSDGDMGVVMRLLDEQSWRRELWVPSFVEKLNNQAEVGNIAAQNNLGLYYKGNLGMGENVFGLDVDFQKSDDWLTKAALKNCPAAQRTIGLNYLRGMGCRQDSYQAKQWLKMAADQGNHLAQTELSELLDDQTEAFRLLTQAAEKRYYRAEYNLGLRYLKGDGVDQNKDTAVVYFKQAAEQSHYESEVALVNMYFIDGGFFEAFDMLNIILNNESVKNQKYFVHYYLGFLYEEGLGDAKRDREKASQFYDTADGLLKKAILAAKEGAEFDSWLPHFNIANFYEKGLYGVPRDLEKARYWYKEAANFGHGYALEKLSELDEKQSQGSGLRRRNVSKKEDNETDSFLGASEDDHENWSYEDRKKRGQLEQEHCVIS